MPQIFILIAAGLLILLGGLMISDDHDVKKLLGFQRDVRTVDALRSIIDKCEAKLPHTTKCELIVTAKQSKE